MIIQEKEMKISQTYRADSAPHEAKSALRGVMQRLGLTLLACTLTIGAAEAQQAATPIDGVIGKLQSFDGKSLDVMTSSGAVCCRQGAPHNLQADALRFESYHRLVLCRYRVDRAGGRKASREAGLHISRGVEWGCGRQRPDRPPRGNLSQQNDQRLGLSSRIALTHDERNSPEERRYYARG
jgi:hypothetical protein